MPRVLRSTVAWLALLSALLVVLAGCGSSKKGSTTKSTATPSSQPPAQAKKGGALTVFYNADVDYIDPGATYYQYGFNVAYATQRPLFSFKPNDTTGNSPDLAAGPAQITDGGKTVTIKIKPGIKFSPPVNREVTSADVKYAIERGFLTSVANGYAIAYLGDVIGAPSKTLAKYKPISGIQTPDKSTIVFKLSRARGAIVAGALSLPLSAPVPKEYASKFDAASTSTYGVHQVATGPYMIQNDASGKLTGYTPNREIKLIRNPNWNSSNDYRKAYLDSIDIKEGTDVTIGSRQILTGSAMVNGDFQVPPPVLSSIVQNPTQKKDNLVVTPPTGRFRYVALNTKVKPFDNINVRKAVIAAFDRSAMRQAFGGPLTGQIPTHFIPPGIAGFDQAGGAKGPGYDFLANENGDPALAASYLKKAGYPSGKITNSPKLLMVSDNATYQLKASQVALNQLQKLGFNIQFRAVARSAMYTNFCNIPSKGVAVCPSVGWLKDFPDPETMLDPTFNGKNIIPANNSNWPQLNDPKINAAMAKAEVLQDPTQRAAAWGEIDKMVTADAPGVPWLWDTQPNLHSSNVNGVINSFDATWDFSFTSLK
jgi:peptide/nickel transport system substrate-binding protein